MMLDFCLEFRQAKKSVYICAADEAEAGSAGEQPAEE